MSKNGASHERLLRKIEKAIVFGFDVTNLQTRVDTRSVVCSIVLVEEQERCWDWCDPRVAVSNRAAIASSITNTYS